MTERWGVYVHIPFCQARCTYCDFNTVTGMGEETHQRYVQALLDEWQRQDTLPAGRLVSLYFGGGTPSLVDPSLLGRVIEVVMQRQPSTGDVEVTVETNPGTVSVPKLRALRQAGVNRLSIGAQARQAHHLLNLNRTHDWDAVQETVAMARAQGFSNLSLDAIYGLPGQTLGEWQETVESLMSLDPDHLSLYALIVEDGTPLKRSIDRHEQSLPDGDVIADMADWAELRLTQAGLFPYEISNFARPGHASRHNQLYWQMDPYLALGAGAHGYRQQRRWWNVRGVRRYMELIDAGQSPVQDLEVMPTVEEMREFVWLGLRQRRGVDVRQFVARYGCHPAKAFASVLASLAEQGLVEMDEETLRLTARGRDLANLAARSLIDAPVEVAPVEALPPT